MINKIIMGILNFVISLINVLLSPIDNLIVNYVPSISEAISFINRLIDYIISVIGYAIDLTLIHPTAIALIVAYYGLMLVVPLAVYVVKFVFKWYNTLKP